MFVGIRVYDIRVHSGTQPHSLSRHTASIRLIQEVLEHLFNPLANKVITTTNLDGEVALELAELVLVPAPHRVELPLLVPVRNDPASRNCSMNVVVVVVSIRLPIELSELLQGLIALRLHLLLPVRVDQQLADHVRAQVAGWHRVFGDQLLLEHIDMLLEHIYLPLEHSNAPPDSTRVCVHTTVLILVCTVLEYHRVHSSVEAIFGSAEDIFGTAVVSFGTVEAIFGTAEASFGTAEAISGTAEASFGTAEASFWHGGGYFWQGGG
jgi:hypothetical protein